MIGLGSRLTEDYAPISKKTFSAAPSIPFEFDIPPEGPVTYAGELFGVDWEIVVGTEGGSGGLDVWATRGFVVACRPAATAQAIEKIPAA